MPCHDSLKPDHGIITITLKSSSIRYINAQKHNYDNKSEFDEYTSAITIPKSWENMQDDSSDLEFNIQYPYVVIVSEKKVVISIINQVSVQIDYFTKLHHLIKSNRIICN